MSVATLPVAVSSGPVIVPSTRFHLGYRPWLDGLRGIAILAVMAYHAEPQLLTHGYVGVDLFFVISGFLITTLLIEEWDQNQKISFQRFYARRALRLFPALSVMLIAASVVMLLYPSVGQHFRSIAYAALYVMNWVMAFDLDQVSSTLYITWSLAIEEQFYLIWPCALYALLRWRLQTRSILSILVLLLIVVCIHKEILLFHGVAITRIAHASDSRADGLIIGCCVGLLASSGLLPRQRKALNGIVTCLSVIFVAYMLGLIRPYGAGLTIVNLFFASLLVVMLTSPPRSWVAFLNCSALRWAGRLSYSLYLWHLFAWFVADRLMGNGFLKVVFAFSLAFAFASVSYYVIERPCLRLKRGLAVVS